MPSSTVEDYLKAIYLAELAESGARIPTGQIAGALDVTPGTATSMIKTLAESGLVKYEPYYGARLTSAGRQLAIRVVRRHRILELFMVKVMGMNWGEVHDEAEQLEHVISDRLLERMDEMLGRPSLDPHGDPIPTEGGEICIEDLPSLLHCAEDGIHRVARVTDQGTQFLKLLERHRVLPGNPIRIHARDGALETVTIRAEGGKKLTLGFRAASKILVRPAEQG